MPIRADLNPTLPFRLDGKPCTEAELRYEAQVALRYEAQVAESRRPVQDRVWGRWSEIPLEEIKAILWRHCHTVEDLRTEQVVIVDIDGTICDASHRLHLIERQPPDWEAWYAACDADEPVIPILRVVDALAERYVIDIITGRKEDSRAVTEAWLKRHEVPYRDLLMRATDDRRPDAVVKREIYRARYAVGEVWLVLEDRNRVVSMWREEGLTCLQVRGGDY